MLLLTTAHRAKGLEFDHVVILDGNWNGRNQNEAEEHRRLYYVAMTRARQTLTLMSMGNGNLFLRPLMGHESVLNQSQGGMFILKSWGIGPEVSRESLGP